MSRWINKYKKTEKLWQDDKYKDVFDKVIFSINKFWSADIQKFMNNEFLSLAEAIDESENRIDEIWGFKPLADFEKEMFRFYKLHEKVFDLYKNGEEEKR